MDDTIRVMVELGQKKRTVACAFDWPGWDRSAKTEDARGPSAGSWWTVQFFIRRSAWHMLDHAWEMEDRDQP